MASKDSKEQRVSDKDKATSRSGETHSGNPNAVDPNDNRSTEHKSGYGGEGGEPRSSSDKKGA